MYLKKLSLRGFKSFADSTELEFGPGITAVVGPNGVGKSNIADAILWVLGEQGYKALRTESSQDVIFSGSESRRPLSMSEVSLTLDNTSGRLPTDFSEVCIARRLFRTGESQYLLNKSVCRLRDVRDLLLGTGIGPDGYSVIGQGEIDAVLSIRSEDRRELIEEVAGIRKYRFRRDDAARKLERTEANLTRIRDIIHELSGQREPLEREAELARQYKQFDARLRTLELQLLARDYETIVQQRGRAANEAAVAKADLTASRGKIAELDAEHARLKPMLDDLDTQVSGFHRSLAEARQRVAEIRQQQAVDRERLRAVEARLTTVAAEIVGQKERLQLLSMQSEEAKQNHTTLVSQLAEAESTLKLHRTAFEQARQEQQQREKSIARLSGRRNQALQRMAALENEAAALEALRSDLQERADRMEKQQDALRQRVTELDAVIAQTGQERAELSQSLQQAAELKQRQEMHVATARALLRDHRAKREQLAAAISRLEERRQVLTELREAYEGYPDGLKTVLAAAKDGRLSGIRGVVGDLLDVPSKLETALQSGLGERLGWIITTSRSEALAAVEFLRSSGDGRAVFFPLVTSVAHTSGPRLAGMSGSVLGTAGQLVKYPRQLARVFEILLGDLVVCTDLPAALEAFERFAGRYRMVTLDGQVVERNGAIRSGPTEVPGAQSFGRKRELGEIEAQLTDLRACLAELWTTEERLDTDLQEARRQLQEAEERLSSLRTEAARAEKEADHLDATRQAASKALSENQQDVDRLSMQLQQAEARGRQVADECLQQRNQVEADKTEIGKLRASSGTEASSEQLRAKLTDCQVRVAEIGEKRNSARRVLQRSTEDIAQVTDSFRKSKAEHESLLREQEQRNQAITGEQAEAVQLYERVTDLERQMQAKTENATQLREQVAAVDDAVRKLNQAASGQSERLHEAEITLTREEGRLQSILERLTDTYEMTPEQALEMRDDELDESAARREARLLRSEIRRLGHVNLSSIEEYERLSAREQFLSSQEEDLCKARDDLLKVIADIDAAAETAFMATFDRVQDAFLGMFEQLFDGGNTRLVLTEPERPLEAGVDILVQLPGKKAQSLPLLSGGERAKVAIALLFAMLKVNPSPFCVLDEIDASLDDANTERFADILHEFSHSTQFVIITHNPYTMERVDTLHGITMEQPGVSIVIPVRLEEAQRQARQTQHVPDTEPLTTQ